MKCSISGCQNVYEKRGQKISFHQFPCNPKILTAWVAATDTVNFIPTYRSKVCSDHFDERAYVQSGALRKLDPKAVPTKRLTANASRRILEYLKKEKEEKVGENSLRKPEENNALACILSMDTPMQKVVLEIDHVSLKTNVPIQSQSPRPPPLTPAPSSTIKVVDMKKLLRPQIQNPSAAIAVQVSAATNSSVGMYATKNLTTSSESNINHTGVTAMQILSCLRIILPGKFDLSRMVPNEKVASLIIRYLKLDEKDMEIQHVVIEHLKLIIEAVKRVDKRSFDLTKHPYTKISDRDLKNALTWILPKNFSMTDITNELLGLICIMLNQDIYSDAFYILIRKIRKFTSEGQKFNEILNRGNKAYDSSLETEKNVGVSRVEGGPNVSKVTGQQDKYVTKPSLDIDIGHLSSIKGDCVDEHRRELVFVDVNNPAVNSQEPADTNSLSESSSNNSFVIETDSLYDDTSDKRKKKKSKVDIDWKPRNEEPDSDSSSEDESKKPKKNKVDIEWEPQKKKPIKSPQLPPYAIKMGVIVRYLHEKKCSAKDVLRDDQLMFDMCRYIQTRMNNSNVKCLESRLNYIMVNKIDIHNVQSHLKKLRFPNQSQLFSSLQSGKPKMDDEKLHMKPVVVIQDIIDFKLGQFKFMRENKVKSNGFYKQIPFSLNQNLCNQKYTTEQVKKLTDDSYKHFRRIVLKRNGNKGVFCVKHIKLEPGTVVFVKNFRYPGEGWMRGVVSKLKGPLNYEVKLGDNSLLFCTVDQLRPILNKVVNNVNNSRSHRPVKPKQLFDL